MYPTKDLTGLLAAIGRGEANATDRFIRSVYNEMHALAARYMRSERSDHTLQPTALVNETYLRLFSQQQVEFEDRAHFFATAAVVMRRILIDHARQRAAAKRDCGKERVDYCDVIAAVEPHVEELLMLDEALNRLAELDSRQAKVVELIYFGGLDESEVAAVFGVCLRTIRRDWRCARAWLQTQLRNGNGSFDARQKIAS
jgi:RNA polymerase sigma factor (TIGR02999 family)